MEYNSLMLWLCKLHASIVLFICIISY